jgi:hypothetical protein
MSSIKQPSATGDDPIPGGSSADTNTAGGGLAGFETRLLSELQLVVAEQAAAGQETGRREGWSRARGAWPRPVVVTGAFSAALVAGLAVALTVASTGAGTHPATGHFAPATTVAAVLDNAAAAALREPFVKPRPGQFVFTKMRAATYDPRHHGYPAEHTTQTIESWMSASGTRVGATVTSGPTTRTVRDYVTACVNGLVKPRPITTPRCTARQFAAYKPWLPTTTAGMRAYLGNAPRDGSRAQSMLEAGYYLLTEVDLTPAQQAATYHALAQVPGLAIVPRVTDILGRAGVGIRSHPAPRMTWTAIFDPTTFKPLGVDIEPVGVGYDRVAVAVQATIVSKVGQRP